MKAKGMWKAESQPLEGEYSPLEGEDCRRVGLVELS